MKTKTLALVLIVSTFSSLAFAVPCSYVLKGFSVGTLDFTHAQPSTRKPLLQIAVTPTTPPEELKSQLGTNVVFHSTYSVADTHFTVDASVSEIAKLRSFTIAATISRADMPDTCFVVWYAPAQKLLDFNIVLEQDPAGALELGSSNRADSALYMTLTPPSIR